MTFVDLNLNSGTNADSAEQISFEAVLPSETLRSRGKKVRRSVRKASAPLTGLVNRPKARLTLVRSVGLVDLENDPKMAWALKNKHFFPVDINKAPRAVLERIPGVHPRHVDQILELRHHHDLTLADLVKIRVSISRARSFIVVADYNPSNEKLKRQREMESRTEGQLSLFSKTP